MPVLRSRNLRRVVAFLLVADGLVLAGGTFITLLWLPHPWLMVVAPAVVPALCLAAAAVARGAPTGWISALALGGAALLHLALAALAAVWAVEAWQLREEHATPSGEIAFPLAVAVIAVLVVAALVACIALPVRRSVVVAVLAGLGLLAAGGSAVAGAAAGSDTCEAFRFSPERWQVALRDDTRGSDDAAKLAEALVRCRTLQDRTRGEVRDLLGPPHRAGRAWTWDVGWTNDFLGPGDEQTFTVPFDRRGRAGAGGLNSPDWS